MMEHVLTRIVGAVSAAMVVGMVGSAQAAVVTWDVVKNIVDDADVSTEGTLDRAYNIGGMYAESGYIPIAPSATVNGVTFTALNVSNHADTALNPNINTPDANTTLSTPLDHLFAESLDPNVGYSTAYNNLSTGYKEIVRSFAYPHNTAWTLISPTELELSGLTQGREYLFQTWISDPRAKFAGRTAYVSSGDVQSDVLICGGGGVGQYVIGRFTADGTSQQFSYLGGAGGVAYANAFQLRVIPEPASLALLMLGAVGLLRRRR